MVVVATKYEKNSKTEPWIMLNVNMFDSKLLSMDQYSYV